MPVQAVIVPVAVLALMTGRGVAAGFTVIVNFTGLQPVPTKKLPNEYGLEPTIVLAVIVLVAVLIVEILFMPLVTT